MTTKPVSRVHLGLTVGVVVLIGLVVIGSLFGRSWQWGDVPTWINAITTTFALVAAAVAAMVAYRLYQIESSREARTAEDRESVAEGRRRAQANKVAAWFDSKDAASKVWGAVIRNASDLPIFDIQVRFVFNFELWSGGPRDNMEAEDAEQLIRVLPPSVDRFIEMPESYRRITEGYEFDIKLHMVEIEFTDAASNRWLRDVSGTLRLPE